MNQYMKGVLCTIIGGACWGISGTCGEYLCTYRGMDTRVLTDMRLLGAGIILCIFLACRERKKLQEFLHTPKALIHCIIFGVCGLMFTQFAYLTAISQDKCRHGYRIAVSVCNYRAAGCMCEKSKITGIAGKYSNYILPAWNVSGGNSWKFYVLIYIEGRIALGHAGSVGGGSLHINTAKITVRVGQHSSSWNRNVIRRNRIFLSDACVEDFCTV